MGMTQLTMVASRSDNE